MKKLFLFQILLVVVTVCLCVVSTKYIIKSIPDDYDRLYKINEWTQDPSISPDIVFFGSSEAMNCVDGDYIKSQYGYDIASYTNTGQSLAEALLFYTRIKAPTKAVVQIIVPGMLGEGIFINDVKANRLVINGYQLDSLTTELLNQRTIEKLHKSFFEACFDIKGYLKNGLHTYLREALEPGQYCDSSNTYLRNAYMYSYERAPEDQYNKILGSMPKVRPSHLEVDNEVIESLRKANDFFKRNSIEYYLVLAPISPKAVNKIPTDYMDVIANLHLNIPVIDMTFLLEDELFADPVHPNREGAKVFSEKVMRKMFEQNDIDE